MIPSAVNLFDEIRSSRCPSGTAMRSKVDALFSNRLHFDLARSELGVGVVADAVKSQEVVVENAVGTSFCHHSPLALVRSLTIGSLSAHQSPRSIGPVMAYHSERGGQGRADRTNSESCSR